MNKALIIWIALTMHAVGQESSNLPTIQNVGVIPLQWSDSSVAQKELGPKKAFLESEFVKAVRSSGKYRVVNDDLVAENWQNPASRASIVKSQEIQGFFSMQVKWSGDVATFALRLLGPDLKTYLFESSTIAAGELKSASRGKVIGLLEDLVFQAVNRIPIDAHITSLQGRYVTIFGGRERGVEVGDKVDIVRAFILSRHPANGAWMKIKSTKLGQATIVEVREQSSVAKLEDMIGEDAIRIGDGMRVPRTKPRAKYKSSELGRARSAAQNAPVVVNPMYPGDTAAKPVLPATPATPVVEAPAKDEKAETGVPLDESAPGTENLEELVDLLVDYGQGMGGMRLWNYSGSASAGSKFPLILVNHGRVLLGKRITSELNAEAIAHANFGSTKKGSFFGFGGGARAYMHRPMEKGKRWKVGAEGQFISLAVTEQTYGGSDIVSGGAFAGVSGPFRLSERMITYYAEFALFPINLGQMGIAGSKRTIQSSFNIRMTLSGEYQLTKAEIEAGELAWGGQVEFESYSYSLDGNKKISGSSFNLLATAAWQF